MLPLTLLDGSHQVHNAHSTLGTKMIHDAGLTYSILLNKLACLVPARHTKPTSSCFLLAPRPPQSSPPLLALMLSSVPLCSDHNHQLVGRRLLGTRPPQLTGCCSSHHTSTVMLHVSPEGPLLQPAVCIHFLTCSTLVAAHRNHHPKLVGRRLLGTRPLQLVGATLLGPQPQLDGAALLGSQSNSSIASSALAHHQLNLSVPLYSGHDNLNLQASCFMFPGPTAATSSALPLPHISLHPSPRSFGDSIPRLN